MTFENNDIYSIRFEMKKNTIRTALDETDDYDDDVSCLNLVESFDFFLVLLQLDHGFAL